ncbi:MAG: hypothetical protein NTY45_09600 [Elusimicrobia bacterium]|nr:hypothetical protein [Elusimicrobiota bacterium]
MRDEVKKRRWAEKHQKNFPVLHREIHERIVVLKNKLWTGDSRPFEWWVSGVMGLIPADLAIFRSFAACLEVKPEEKFFESFFSLISANSAIEYFNRVEKGKHKILLYEKPSKIPTGYIHLFDLTPKELSERLNIAINKHGVDKEKAFLIKWARTTPELPEECGINSTDPLFHKSEAQKHALLDRINQQPEKLGIKDTMSDEKKQQIAEKICNPVTAKITKERLAQISVDYKRERPKGDSYYNEQLKSLVAGKNRPGNSLGKYLQEEKLKVIKGVVSDFGAISLANVSGYEAPAALEPGNPDELYRLQQVFLNMREDVQGICSSGKSRDEALLECQKKYPELTTGQIAEYRASESHNTSKALQEAALQMGLMEMDGKKLDYANTLFYIGKSTAQTNKLWTDYLDEYFPGTGDMTLSNLPETPPVTLPKS